MSRPTAEQTPREADPQCKAMGWHSGKVGSYDITWTGPGGTKTTKVLWCDRHLKVMLPDMAGV